MSPLVAFAIAAAVSGPCVAATARAQHRAEIEHDRLATTAEVGLGYHGGAGGQSFGIAAALAGRRRTPNDRGVFGRLEYFALSRTGGIGDADVNVVFADLGYRWGAVLAGDAAGTGLFLGGALGGSAGLGLGMGDWSVEHGSLGGCAIGDLELRLGWLVLGLLGDLRALFAVDDVPLELTGTFRVRAGIDVSL